MTSKNLLILFLSVLFIFDGRGAIYCAQETKTIIVESMTVSPAPATVEPKAVAIDTNKDGKPDRWEYHDGNKVRVEADTNFDGKIDEIAYFENGKLVKGEKDSDYDGKMDKWIDY